MDEITIKEIYNNLLTYNYSDADIIIYFMLKYNINININDIVKKRIGQKEFRNSLIDRFGGCIITGSDIFDACHIVPYSENVDMHIDNGILLTKTYHDYFDKYIWSINPDNYQIEINYNIISKGDFFIKNLLTTDLEFLQNYPLMKLYLSKHYKIFNNKIKSYSKYNE